MKGIGVGQRAEGESPRDYHKFTWSNCLLYMQRLWKSERGRKQVQYRGMSKMDGKVPKDNQSSAFDVHLINNPKLKIHFMSFPWVKSHWMYVVVYQVSGSCMTWVIRNRGKCCSAVVQQAKDREQERGMEKEKEERKTLSSHPHYVNEVHDCSVGLSRVNYQWLLSLIGWN